MRTIPRSARTIHLLVVFLVLSRLRRHRLQLRTMMMMTLCAVCGCLMPFISLASDAASRALIHTVVVDNGEGQKGRVGIVDGMTFREEDSRWGMSALGSEDFVLSSRYGDDVEDSLRQRGTVDDSLTVSENVSVWDEPTTRSLDASAVTGSRDVDTKLQSPPVSRRDSSTNSFGDDVNDATTSTAVNLLREQLLNLTSSSREYNNDLASDIGNDPTVGDLSVLDINDTDSDITSETSSDIVDLSVSVTDIAQHVLRRNSRTQPSALHQNRIKLVDVYRLYDDENDTENDIDDNDNDIDDIEAEDDERLWSPLSAEHQRRRPLIKSVLSGFPTLTSDMLAHQGPVPQLMKAGVKRLPQAIIIGVKKGGTRALLEFLRTHPDIRAPGPEIHFFDKNYDKGLEWYRNQMPATLSGQITIEKTPSYWITKNVPSRVHSMSKTIRLIVVVRDPATRALSDYAQAILKRPDFGSFESRAFIQLNASTRNYAVAEGGESGRGGGLVVDTSWGAIRIGLYARHLARWLEYFPRENVHFVHGERLISDPAGELAHVQDFLGLKRLITDKHFYFNATKGFPCLKKSEGSANPHCLGKTKGRTHPFVNPHALQRLRDFYKPFNEKFYDMSGTNFQWL